MQSIKQLLVNGAVKAPKKAPKSLRKDFQALINKTQQTPKHDIKFDLPLWKKRIEEKDQKDFQMISDILLSQETVVTNLKKLNKKVENMKIIDPEEAFHQYCLKQEQKGGHFNDPFITRDQMGMDDFMNLIEKKHPIIDLGVSFHHGSHTHRIQQEIIRMELGNKKTADIFSRMANKEYVRPNPLYKQQGPEIQTIWDDLMDRHTLYYIKNDENLPSGDITKCKKMKISHELYPTIDIRNPEYLSFLLRFTQDKELGLLNKLFIIDQLKRYREVHHGLYQTGLEYEQDWC